MNYVDKIMNETGPVVGVLILKVDGSIVEEKWDMTPKLNKLGEYLNDCVTFVGQYEEDCGNVIVVTKGLNKCNKKIDKNFVNKHILPEPFNDDDDNFGDMVLIRMNSEAIPQDLVLSEWVELCSTKKPYLFNL